MGFLKNVGEKLLGRDLPPPLMSAEAAENSIRDALRRVIDPDLHKDIVTLGFVKRIAVSGDHVTVDVSLTTPACPVKELLKSQCEEAVKSVPGIARATINMTAETRGGPSARQEGTAASLGGVRNIIAVASGKGGVGKSTTAVNLAFALRASGSRVGLLDADVYGPSLPQMTKAGLPKRSEGQMVVPPEVDGVKVISAAMFSSAGQATILRGPMAAQIIKQFLTQVAWGDLDYLVIDYPPGTGDIQLTLSQTAPITGAVIVTTPQEVALIDVRRAINMFQTLKVPVLGVIETMSYFVCDGCTKQHDIFRRGGGARVAGEAGLPLLGEIPLDPTVAVDSDSGLPSVAHSPNSVASAAYRTAAGQVAAQLSILNSRDGAGLLTFVLDWQ